jgi:hypothetical protein
MSTEKKPRKPRVVAPKTALELELEKGFEHAKELTTATKQVARIVGKFRSSEQQSILRQVWAFVQIRSLPRLSSPRLSSPRLNSWRRFRQLTASNVGAPLRRRPSRSG